MSVELHVHTEDSYLDGLTNIDQLFERGRELGFSAIAITNHGNCNAWYEAQLAGEKFGVQPIFGIEFYIEIESKRYHLIAYAMNEIGMKNIYKLQEWSSVYNQLKGRPCITLNKLYEFNEGIIISTACIGSYPAKLITSGQMQKAIEHLLDLKAHFGDRIYLELQTNSIAEQKLVNETYQQLSKDLSIKAIISCDLHYLKKEDARVHEVLLCIQQKRKWNDKKRWKFPGGEDYYLQTEEEKRKLLSYLDEDFINSAFHNANDIKVRCSSTKIEYKQYLPHMPGVPVEKEREVLGDLCNKKFIDFISEEGIDKKDLPKYITRMKTELDVYEQTGYCGYMLIVSDYARWAREHGILVGDGRGSGAGSLVARVIGITGVDPIKYGLLFERFLTPGRIPDFD